METIYIPRILSKSEQTEVIDFDEFIPDLASLTPVRGQLQVTHQGTYLKVKAKAETIVTLTCHRCLKQYNHRLRINSSELIWLDKTADRLEPSSIEMKVDFEDLVETLSPTGSFSPSDWLYEQLCLAEPHKQICDSKCVGIIVNNDEANTESSETIPDRRWASLKSLKQQLP